MDVQRALEWADLSPYDYPDDWDGKPIPSPDWAHRAARAVIHNLQDRRNIKWGFDNVDEDVRAEIVETLAAIIRAASPSAPLSSSPEPVPRS